MSWTPPEGTLGRIVAETGRRVDELRQRRGDLERIARDKPNARSLAEALRGVDVAILAEVKRRSPSKGGIAEGLKAEAQAIAYERGGARAVSVLTEPAHFGGSIQDLLDVSAAVAIPVLKKDFHVDPIQLIEAKAVGASAALLIARAVSPEALLDLMRFGLGLGLELLVEVRDERELELAVSGAATMIGVNNRDLESLLIDPTTAERLVPMVPEAIVAVAESGVGTRDDVSRYAAAGADAVLVGSVLSAAGDPATATAALAGVPRRHR
ncbi:MAG: indole-3-glycerol-phosphate synthase [Gemmatimonadaceae bacterium]|nr:indole-3-glycerol-phosphate synthase [Gemmatimonadaceae bacterium]